MITQTHQDLVSCIIVTYNSETVIRKCLDALLSSDYPSIEVIVVENASSDTTRGILESYPKKVGIIENSMNAGLSKALNQGIEASKGELVLVLNPDTFLCENTMSILVTVIKKKGIYGCAAPKLLRSDKTIDCAGIKKTPSGRFINRGESQKDQGQYDTEGLVFGASGACALYKRKMLESIKIDSEYFDEDFFAYKEDVDLALRANRLGWKTIYMPKAIAEHDRGFKALPKAGNDNCFSYCKKRLSYEISNSKNKYFRFVRSVSFRNNIYLFIKNFNIADALEKCHLKVCRLLVLIPFYILFEPYVLKQTVNILKNLGKMFKKRKVINNLSGLRKKGAKQSFDHKILLVNHEETRTGAPKVFLELYKHLSSNIEIITISLAKGSMHKEFKETAAKTIYPQLPFLTHVFLHELNVKLEGLVGKKAKRLIVNILMLRKLNALRIRRLEHKSHRIISGLNPDLVFINSIVSHKYAVSAKKLKIPTVYCVHELAHFLEDKDVKTFAASADLFIAVSESVSHFLITDLGCSPSKVKCIPAFISSDKVLSLAKETSPELSFFINRKNSGHKLIAAMGEIHTPYQIRRKGVDILIKAYKMLKKNSDLKFQFVWIGRFDIKQLKLHCGFFEDLSDDFVFLGEKINPYPYLNAADIFVLPSRMDPLPLSVLEAMALGKPIIAFKDGGGIPEVIRECCGLVVNQTSPEELAEAILKMSQNNKVANNFSKNGKIKQKEHYDAEVCVPQIEELIRSLLVSV